MEAQQTQFNALYSQFLAWQQSQQNQTDGYEFERSFLAFCQQLSQDLLKLTLEQTAIDTSKKKSSPV